MHRPRPSTCSLLRLFRHRGPKVALPYLSQAESWSRYRAGTGADDPLLGPRSRDRTPIPPSLARTCRLPSSMRLEPLIVKISERSVPRVDTTTMVIVSRELDGRWKVLRGPGGEGEGGGKRWEGTRADDARPRVPQPSSSPFLSFSSILHHYHHHLRPDR